MNVLWRILVYVGIVVAVFVLGFICIFLLLLPCVPSICFASYIVYFLKPKLGTVGYSIAIIMAIIYLIVMASSYLGYQPLHYLMSTVLAISAVIMMLIGEPRWKWIAVSCIFICCGIYCFFDNGIIGPTAFMIRDRPIDIPGQWNHCYRFFWAGVLIDMIVSLSAILSSTLILISSILTLFKDDLKNLLYKGVEF